jgi:hypothetical protein
MGLPGFEPGSPAPKAGSIAKLTHSPRPKRFWKFKKLSIKNGVGNLLKRLFFLFFTMGHLHMIGFTMTDCRPFKSLSTALVREKPDIVATYKDPRFLTLGANFNGTHSLGNITHQLVLDLFRIQGVTERVLKLVGEYFYQTTDFVDRAITDYDSIEGVDPHYLAPEGTGQISLLDGLMLPDQETLNRLLLGMGEDPLSLRAMNIDQRLLIYLSIVTKTSQKRYEEFGKYYKTDRTKKDKNLFAKEGEEVERFLTNDRTGRNFVTELEVIAERLEAIVEANPGKKVLYVDSLQCLGNDLKRRTIWERLRHLHPSRRTLRSYVDY